METPDEPGAFQDTGMRGRAIGYNCLACGALLNPIELREFPREIVDRFPQETRVRRLSCRGCSSVFLLYEGRQPDIYQDAVLVCVKQGEKA